MNINLSIFMEVFQFCEGVSLCQKYVEQMSELLVWETCSNTMILQIREMLVIHSLYLKT